jgi:hypothetical protein
LNSGGLFGKYLYKPQKCIFHRRGEAPTAGTILTVKHLRWKGWSGSRARAIGKARGNAGHFRVRLTLAKVQHPCGTAVFSQVTFRSMNGSPQSWRIDNCLVSGKAVTPRGI